MESWTEKISIQLDNGAIIKVKVPEVATQNQDFLSRSFDLDEMRQDVELFEAMYPLLLALTQLHELVDDTVVVVAHGGRIGDISIYGQESNPTTWKLCKMNLAIRGIDCNLGFFNADSFHNDQHKDLKADFILANPPFNMSDWGGDRLREDGRWKYSSPPVGNAN